MSSKYSFSSRTRRGSAKACDQALFHRLERDDVLVVGQNNAADGDHVHVADGLANHGEGVMPDLAVGR